METAVRAELIFSIPLSRVLVFQAMTERMSYDRADCIDAIQYVAGTLDKSPSQTEYQEHRRDSDPSVSTIHYRLGSWNGAKEEVGLGTPG
jgi:hypothetical protein